MLLVPPIILTCERVQLAISLTKLKAGFLLDCGDGGNLGQNEMDGDDAITYGWGGHGSSVDWISSSCGFGGGVGCRGSVGCKQQRAGSGQRRGTVEQLNRRLGIRSSKRQRQRPYLGGVWRWARSRGSCESVEEADFGKKGEDGRSNFTKMLRCYAGSLQAHTALGWAGWEGRQGRGRQGLGVVCDNCQRCIQQARISTEHQIGLGLGLAEEGESWLLHDSTKTRRRELSSLPRPAASRREHWSTRNPPTHLEIQGPISVNSYPKLKQERCTPESRCQGRDILGSLPSIFGQIGQIEQGSTWRQLPELQSSTAHCRPISTNLKCAEWVDHLSIVSAGMG